MEHRLVGLLDNLLSFDITAHLLGRDFVQQALLAAALLGLVAGLIAPFIVNQSGLVAANASAPPFHAPSWQYPLGTDNFGRSVLGLVVMGSRISLLVGLTATVGAMVIGAAVGITSGTCFCVTAGTMARVFSLEYAPRMIGT